MIFKMQYPVFTDFNPNCSLNEYIQKKYNTGNSHEYRYFLQKNANNLRNSFSDCASKNANICTYHNDQSKWKPLTEYNK